MKKKSRFIMRLFSITKLLFNSNKKIYVLCVLLSIFSGIIPVVSSYSWKLLLDEIQYVGNETKVLNVILLLSFLGGVKLISIAVGDIGADIKSLQADYFNIYLTDRLLEVLNDSELSCFDDSNYYNDYDMVCNQSLQKSMEIGTSLSNIMISIISVFTSFIVLSSLNPILIVLILMVGTPSLFAQTSISKKMFKIFENRVEDLRYTQFLKSFMIQYNNIKEIKILNAGNYFKNQIISLYDNYVKENKKLMKEFNLKKIAVNLVQLFVSVCIQIFMLLSILRKGDSIGNVVFYLQTYLNGESAIASIFTEFSKIYESDLYIQKLLIFLNKNDDKETKKEKDEEFEQIIFDNVSFSYPGDKREVLKNLHLTIEKGKSYAVIGRNGSGKSTFVKLLLNLYDEYEGEIFYNSWNIKKNHIKNYTKKFNVIFQDFIRYPLSVRENIGISNTEEIHNMKYVDDVAKASGAKQFIDELPKSYETNLFKQWTSGTDLSLGQWQRIGFARAIFKKGDLLVMDEPTSALDAFAEKEIVDLAKSYCKTSNKTSILISHRLSNVKDVDEILVFDKGTVIERGTHDELLKKEGLYYELFTVQAKSYTD